MPEFIRFEDLRKEFSEAGQRRTVLAGVSGGFARGEFVAVIGRSGSGKSTLLNLIAGIDLPTAGRIWIDSLAVSALPDRERTIFRRDHIGFVFQFFNLIPTLQVLENVQLSAALAGHSPADSRARAERLLAEVGLADRAGVFPDRLSGGEQQRVAIARALCADPDVVLADEPTGNLDAATGAQVLALLVRLTRARGKTLVVVTHSRELASQADRVFRLAGGLLEPVTPAQLGAFPLGSSAEGTSAA
jgi:putative ABC transport system ATP-binding protein